MWLWECELHQLGLRRLSARYWKGERRYGLPDGAYLSLFTQARFSDARERRATTRASKRERVDIGEFHVTFCLGMDQIHFYFHEVAEGVWEPGGHTSGAEIRRYAREPLELRALADRVAAAFVSALGLELRPRGE